MARRAALVALLCGSVGAFVSRAPSAVRRANPFVSFVSSPVVTAGEAVPSDAEERAKIVAMMEEVPFFYFGGEGRAGGGGG